MKFKAHPKGCTVIFQTLCPLHNGCSRRLSGIASRSTFSQLAEKIEMFSFGTHEKFDCYLLFIFFVFAYSYFCKTNVSFTGFLSLGSLHQFSQTRTRTMSMDLLSTPSAIYYSFCFSLMFLLDDYLLLSASSDKTVAMWDIRKPRVLSFVC